MDSPSITMAIAILALVCLSAYFSATETAFSSLNRIRLKAARTLLRTTTLTIREVSAAVGIENTTHFINLFKKDAGITPLQFRQSSLH